MIWVIIIAAIIGLDQFTKYIVVQNIEMNSTIPVIKDFFYFTYIRNSGAAWGIFQSGRIFFIVLTIAVSITLFMFLFRAENRILKVSLSFVLGGAIGNLIDRITIGSVVDFLQFHFGSYIFPNFNVADSFVVIGTFILAYYMLFIYKDKEKDLG